MLRVPDAHGPVHIGCSWRSGRICSKPSRKGKRSDKIRAVTATPPSDRQPRRLAYVEAVTRGKDAGLVLADDAGSRYILGVDQAVLDAIRTVPVSNKQVPQPARDAEPADIGPREIQALIRAGQTAQDVADAHGLDLARVQRYEGPVLAERAWMADRAQTTELRRPEGAKSLGELVGERLAARGDDLASLEWDAWRRDDHRWLVEATWLALGAQIGDDAMASARWIFDPVGHTIVPDDAAARALVEDMPTTPAARTTRKQRPGGDPYVDVASADDDLTAIARATAATPPAPATPMDDGNEPAWTPVVVDGGKTDESAPQVQVQPEPAQPEPAQPAVREFTREPVEETVQAEFDLEGVDTPADDVSPVAAPTQSRPRRSGRARIPSWDEILLGTQGNTDQN